MRILSFQVEGYKNLRGPLRMDGLSPVTAIYGPNNVGKSNLIEAMALVFTLLGIDDSGPLPFNNPAQLTPQRMTEVGYPLNEIFTFGAPTPIRLEMDIEVLPAELVAAGIQALFPALPLSIAIEIAAGPPAETWQVTRFRFSDGSDIRRKATPEQLAYVRRYSLFLARNYLLGGGGGQRAFQVVNSQRSQLGSGRDAVPAELALAMYDRQESTTPEVFAQYTAFHAMISEFTDVIGFEEIRAVFNRQAGRAQFVAQRGSKRMPLHLLGTGVQQLVILLGTLATSGAHIAAVEEPEANLSFGIQLRLREVLRKMPALGGPSQILFTSHSPGFQMSDELYVMQQGEAGPTLTRLAASAVEDVTGVVLAGADRPTGRAPVSWVTEEGLVRLPSHVLDGLGLRKGGGVVFFTTEEGTFEILTNASAIARLGWGEE